MLEDAASGSAFGSFRALSGTPNIGECDQLIRNMAQLFSHVSGRCDDEQVAQYDEILCQLADLVESEARSAVASLLAPLERAPGSVVVKLANDEFSVAQPLLEFSNVLSDDDLIEIASSKSEEYRVAIAGRPSVTDRVGDAIVTHGERASIERLVANEKADLGAATMPKLVAKARENSELSSKLRARPGVDWDAVSKQLREAGESFAAKVAPAEQTSEGGDSIMTQARAVAFNRLRNKAGFEAGEWKIAWNQVKGLNDRRKVDERSLERFARFGYGHHVAAAMTIMLNIKPEVLVKWLAAQDYVAMTVAGKALGLHPTLFAACVSAMPWRDVVSDEDLEKIKSRFETLSGEEATDIFDLWRAHAFRRREAAPGNEPIARAS